MNDVALSLSLFAGLFVVAAAIDFIRYAIRENRKERDREYLIEVFRRRGELYPEQYLEMLEEREALLRARRKERSLRREVRLRRFPNQERDQ